MRGLFITFEGPDGSGKSTIIKMVGEQLEKDFPQIKVDLTREPGGTNNKIAEDIRQILLNNDTYHIDYHAEALLFAASRSQHIHDFILPNLEKNHIVLCDRYVHSSLVYQGYGRELGKDNIWSINAFAMHGVIPDLTVLLMADPAIGIARINQNSLREVNRLDKEHISFHQKVYQAYTDIIKDDPTKSIKVIDAERPLAQVFNDVYQVICAQIKNKYGI